MTGRITSSLWLTMPVGRNKQCSSLDTAFKETLNWSPCYVVSDVFLFGHGFHHATTICRLLWWFSIDSQVEFNFLILGGKVLNFFLHLYMKASIFYCILCTALWHYKPNYFCKFTLLGCLWVFIVCRKHSQTNLLCQLIFSSCFFFLKKKMAFKTWL